MIMNELQTMQGWKLFLDDERELTYDLRTAIVAIDSDEAIRIVLERGTVPELISFDHDLGKDENGVVKPTAMKFLWWLIDMDLDGHFDLNDIKRIIIHSRNEQGAANLAGLWNGYAADIKSDVRAELRPRSTLTT